MAGSFAAGRTMRTVAATLFTSFGLFLLVGLFSPAVEAKVQAGPNDFACSADRGALSWTDDGQSRYWVYRSTNGGLSYNWLGRTLGATTFTDPAPVQGVTYQVHYAGIPRVDCAIVAEPGDGDGPFACEVDGSSISWTDDGQSRYWVYRSTNGGLSYNWLGRTLGATTFTDPAPVQGVTYQVHYAGIPRVDCAIVAEPGDGDGPFACEVDGSSISWTDDGQSKYWVYRSTNGGLSYNWLGRTLGATTFTDPAPVQGVTYQVHYAGIPRVDCATSSEPTPEPTPIWTPDVVTELPGTIEAESYFRAIDTTPGNEGLATEYNDDVDVWPMLNGDGHIVGLTEQGESTSYRVRVAVADSYTFAIANASGGVGSTVTVRVNGAKVGATTDLAPTSGWWEFVQSDVGAIDLDADWYIVTVQWGRGQSNFDGLIVRPSSASCVVGGVIVQSALAASECEVLAAIFEAGQSGDPCQWRRVTCNAAGTSVAKLDLSFNGRSVLPPEIGDFTGLTELDLDGNSLTSLPTEIGNLTTLTHLILGGDLVDPGRVSGNLLTSLPSEIGNLTNLVHLDLRKNKLTALPAEISNLTGLTSFGLSENELVTLPPEIGNLTNLPELSVSVNRLTVLPGEIGNLTALTNLNVSANQLTALPPEIGNLTALTKLNVSLNELTMLPNEIGNLSNLTRFQLHENNLTTLPPEIGNLTGLTELDLSPNRLTTLPPEIGNLTGLLELDLSTNRLTTLPPEIGDLANLTDLDLSSNQLTTLPTEFGDLANLTDLDLSSNQFAVLPLAVTNLSSVNNLDLRSNNLTTLPPEVGNLIDVYALLLSGNPINSLPSEIADMSDLRLISLEGSGLTSLPVEITTAIGIERLDLSENELVTLPPEIANLTNLKWIDLDNNQITTMPLGVTNLTALTHLDLRDNNVNFLPDEIGNLVGLRWIDLDGNTLTSLPAGIGNFTQVGTFNLAGNDLASLPPEIGNLTQLGQLDLRGNRLTTLPTEIGNLSVRLLQIDLRENLLRGDVSQLATVNINSIDLADGPGGNDCLTVADNPANADLLAYLNRWDRGWDLCENP